MNSSYFICDRCVISENIRRRERERREEIEARRQPKWTKRRSDGKKNLKPLFQFLCLSQQQHTFIASKQARAYSLYSTQQKFISTFPALILCSPSAEAEQNPDPGFDRPIFMPYTQRVFDRFLCWCETGREWHEQRRGALYCVIFYTHTFYPTYKVLYQKAKGKNWREMANFSFERRKKKMLWNGLKEKRGQNNSSNNIRKFILKAHSVSLLLSVRYFFFDSLERRFLLYETLDGG